MSYTDDREFRVVLNSLNNHYNEVGPDTILINDALWFQERGMKLPVVRQNGVSTERMGCMGCARP